MIQEFFGRTFQGSFLESDGRNNAILWIKSLFVLFIRFMSKCVVLNKNALIKRVGHKVNMQQHFGSCKSHH